MLKCAFLATGFALAYGASYANNCDDLKTQIESKIKAAGVASFAVTVVDSAATAAGKVVGSCDRGAKKIMYVQNGTVGTVVSAAPVSPASSGPNNLPKATTATSPTTAASKPKPPTKASGSGAILTECKDGSSSLGGTCKK
jgi:Protein of unknown function (DUF1161)